MQRSILRSGAAMAAAAALGVIAPVSMAQQGSSWQGQSGPRLDPEAVSLIGVDLDGDQIADTVYAVSRYDVEQMKRKADGEKRMRQQQGNLQQPRFQQSGFQQSQFQQPGSGQMQRDQMMRQHRAQTMRQQQATQPVNVTGRIESTKTVRIPAFQSPHRLAKVQTQGGRTAIVDLGPVNNLRNVNIRRGSQIQVSGHRGTLNDRTVIFANRLQADGRSLRVNYQPTGRFGTQLDRQQRGFRQMPARFNAGQLRQLSGTVQSKERMTIGESDPYLFIELETDQGQTHLVNLGPARELQNVDLQQGDTIQVWANPMTLAGGERIFHTQRFSANGETINVSQLTGGRGMTAALGGQQQARRISGTVESRKRVTFGDSEPYVFADVQTDQGRTVLVNLGPEQELQDVDIQEGDNVTVWGNPMTLAGGERIIHTQRLSTNGQNINVQQLHQRAKQREQQRRQQRGD